MVVPAKGMIALIAHDDKKGALADWVVGHKDALAEWRVVCTATTGRAIKAHCAGLSIRSVRSGPLGGDLQIGAMIADGRVEALIFFPDPMMPMPHDVDVKALLRIALDLPCALNPRSADLLIAGLCQAKPST